MKILHTSDWHIGSCFHNRKRDAEYESFLSWLSEEIERRKIDVLIVSGDVFDSSAPGNNAVRMYYDFLKRLQETSCRMAVFTGGNHDSPSFLNAPRELLRSAFPIYVFGGATENPAEEAVCLRDDSGEPLLVIGAVPYLRDADLTSMKFGEDLKERELRRREGFRSHYRAVSEAAEEIRNGREIPFILTGHFFLSGGRFGLNDGMRELVGGIAEADSASLPENADYIALGHLHQPQKVGTDRIRYSGSPLKMSFSDSDRRLLYEISFSKRDFLCHEIEVPCFTAIRSLRGDWMELEPRLREIAESPFPIYCELAVRDLSGSELIQKTDDLFRGRMENYPLILRSELSVPSKNPEGANPPDVASMTESEVFELLLERRGISSEEASVLRELYSTTVASVLEDDKNT